MYCWQTYYAVLWIMVYFDMQCLNNRPQKVQQGVIISWQSLTICQWCYVPHAQKCWEEVSYQLELTTWLMRKLHKLYLFTSIREDKRKTKSSRVLISVSHTSHPDLQSHTTTADHCSLHQEGQQVLALGRKCQDCKFILSTRYLIA